MNIIISVSIYNRTNQKCSLEASWIKGHFFLFWAQIKTSQSCCKWSRSHSMNTHYSFILAIFVCELTCLSKGGCHQNADNWNTISCWKNEKPEHIPHCKHGRIEFEFILWKANSYALSQKSTSGKTNILNTWLCHQPGLCFQQLSREAKAS